MDRQISYRDYLRDAYLKRSRLEPKYTMSSFAEHLSLSPSRLSEIMSGKQGISRVVAETIVSRLQLSDADRTHFCDLVEYEHGRSREKRDLAAERLKIHAAQTQFKLMKNDAFEIVSTWYHFAILELMLLPSFTEDPRWIACHLGIRAVEARDAFERLIRVGAVIRDKNDKFVRAERYVATTDDVPSSQIRKFHDQILSKARYAQETQSIEYRSFSSNFIAMSKDDLPFAKELLKSFRRRFSKQLESRSSTCNSVYNLSIQFFELTNPGEKQ